MSTVGLEPVLRLADALPAAEQLLDAPVLGSLTEVEAGSLTVFAGAAPDLVRHWTPTLSALGTVLHVGPPGAGAAAKLVANSTLLGVLGVLGEALALGSALGLPSQIVFDVLARTPVAAQAQRRQPAVETGEYPLRFALDLAVKDADLVVKAGESSGADLRLAAAARSWFTDAAQAAHADRDYSEILAHILATTRS
jgi:3-hydroxyisobutyrate dehydrogenase/2-hydroxy-3-oxopropionate reductase